MISALLMTLSTMLEGNLPSEWFYRSSFRGRRILLFYWIIFCLIMRVVYSYVAWCTYYLQVAHWNLVLRSILASKTITPTLYVINTAQDLLRSELNVQCTSGTANYLKASSRSTIQKMESKIFPGLFNSFQENIARYVTIGDYLVPIVFSQSKSVNRAKQGEIVIVADKNWGSMNGLHTGSEKLIMNKCTSPIISRKSKLKERLIFSILKVKIYKIIA